LVSRQGRRLQQCSTDGDRCDSAPPAPFATAPRTHDVREATRFAVTAKMVVRSRSVCLSPRIDGLAMLYQRDHAVASANRYHTGLREIVAHGEVSAFPALLGGRDCRGGGRRT